MKEAPKITTEKIAAITAEVTAMVNAAYPNRRTASGDTILETQIAWAVEVARQEEKAAKAAQA